MKKTKSTWCALLLSLMSLMLCATMLVGGTYAWFTDSNTTKYNKISTGSMDVALSQIKAGTGGALTETDITNSSVPIFNDDLDWVPGDAIILSFKIKNIGTLALKWQIHLETNVANKDIPKEKLAGLIDVFAFINTDIVDPTKDSSYYAEKMGTKKGTLQDLYYGCEFLNGVLDKTGDEQYFAIVLKLKSGLDASHQGLKAGKFDIRIVAAQASTESDVYNDLYDDVIYVTSGKDFIEADYGGKIVMPADVYYYNEDPDNQMLLYSNSPINFDGGGNTITVSGTDPDIGNHNYVAFIPPAKADATVSNLKVTGTGYVEVGDYGVRPGGNYTVNNLVLENMCSSYAVNDKIRLAVGFGHYGTATLNNCIMTGTTALDTTANAYDIGLPNSTHTTINGGEYGKLYSWAQAHVAIYGAKIGTIDSCALAYNNMGSMVIGAGTTVDTINVFKTGSYACRLIIDPGANVGTINYNGNSYTMAQWLALYPSGLNP